MLVFVTIFIFFALGVFAQKLKTKKAQISITLNRLIIHITFPALILTTVPTMPITWDIAIPTISYWALIPLVLFLAIAFKRLLRWPKEIQTAFFAICITGNTGFLGVPLVNALLSQAHVPYAIIYDQFGTFIGVSTIVIIAIAQYESATATLDFKKLITRLLTFTPFPILLISILLPIEGFLQPIDSVLTLLAYLVMPAAMMVVGLHFRLQVMPEHIKPLAIILLVKLFFLPLVLFIILKTLNVDAIILETIVFQAAAAPMITTTILLLASRIVTPLVSSALSIGTLVSFVTLPVLAMVL